jgi:hypothetical protein
MQSFDRCPVHDRRRTLSPRACTSPARPASLPEQARNRLGVAESFVAAVAFAVAGAGTTLQTVNRDPWPDPPCSAKGTLLARGACGVVTRTDAQEERSSSDSARRTCAQDRCLGLWGRTRLFLYA